MFRQFGHDLSERFELLFVCTCLEVLEISYGLEIEGSPTVGRGLDTQGAVSLEARLLGRALLTDPVPPDLPQPWLILLGWDLGPSLGLELVNLSTQEIVKHAAGEIYKWT